MVRNYNVYALQIKSRRKEILKVGNLKVFYLKTYDATKETESDSREKLLDTQKQREENPLKFKLRGNSRAIINRAFNE